MTFEIRQTDLLTESEYQNLFHWGDDVFGANAYNLTWRAKTLHFLIDEGENPISHVGVLKHTVYVDGAPVTVGGVGGVVTLPAAQRKGCAAHLMRHAEEFFARRWRVEAGLLFCLPKMNKYYENLGWRRIEEAVMIEQPGGVIESPMGVMILPLGDGKWQKGTIELRSPPW
jgi:GNAT superfamily N-acetyltransferase